MSDIKYLVIYPQVLDDNGEATDSGKRLIQPLHPDPVRARKQQEQWESIYVGLPARMEITDTDPRNINPVAPEPA